MTQQFDYPKTDTQLRELCDILYQKAKDCYQRRTRPTFTGLVEMMSAEPTIITAIHNIKSNTGSQTPGIDKRNVNYYLQKPFQWVIEDIQSAFSHYKPKSVRRVYIDKPGKTEKRPLGIPAIRDRIIQECIRIVIEPIVEAQFFNHSYGFRPMRNTKMALYRVSNLVHRTGFYWIVEGDISKCFEKIDHSVLLKRLYHIGIKDRRVLQIIKTMLKAGVAGECSISEYGTPQGGVLSPLLANVYMDMMDEWITSQWENKKTRSTYSRHDVKLDALKKRSRLIPGYLVRYADDFVIITDSREHAESWKNWLKVFLLDKLRLTLSEEKTIITDVRKTYIHFLGYEYKASRGKSRKGYITRTRPDEKRLKAKVDSIADTIKKIPLHASKEQLIQEIILINSQIRGIINYYSNCTRITNCLGRHAYHLQWVAKKRLQQYRGRWIPANRTKNLPHIHGRYTMGIPAVKYEDMYIGVTSLSFCKWEEPRAKMQDETPYTHEGRGKYLKRTKKARQLARLDAAVSDKLVLISTMPHKKSVYNFEYAMNRAYALNRDKFKCRVCGRWMYNGTIYVQHINPHLPLHKVNKVSNLASMHPFCDGLINDFDFDISALDTKTQRKVLFFRKQLVLDQIP